MAESGDAEDPIPVGRALEVDSSDADSAIGNDTVSSSITDYRHENGRRYHAYHDGSYYLPNDEIEADRLDLQHHVWRLTLNGALSICPTPPPEIPYTVLDVGTGTGIWAIEYAEAHPNAQIIGTDLSPIQPDFVPPNCSFIVDNAEQEWVFEKPFDYIHSRMLILGMHDWSRYFQQCWDNLKPGGWLELQEILFPLRCDDESATLDSPFLKWGSNVQEAASRVGIDTVAAEKFDSQLHSQGFTNIRHERIMWAVGSWPRGQKEKEIGRYTQFNLTSGLQGLSMALFTRHLGWSREAVEINLIEVRKDLMDRCKHFYCDMHMHVAQKPLGHPTPRKEPESVKRATSEKSLSPEHFPTSKSTGFPTSQSQSQSQPRGYSEPFAGSNPSTGFPEPVHTQGTANPIFEPMSTSTPTPTMFSEQPSHAEPYFPPNPDPPSNPPQASAVSEPFPFPDPSPSTTTRESESDPTDTPSTT